MICEKISIFCKTLQFNSEMLENILQIFYFPLLYLTNIQYHDKLLQIAVSKFFQITIGFSFFISRSFTIY